MFSKLLCGVLIVLSGATYSSAYWIIEDVDVNGGDPHIGLGSPNSIAIDASDKTHIVYDRYTSLPQQDDQLKYAFWDGDTWQISIVDETSYQYFFSGLSLVTNSLNLPSFVYTPTDSSLKFTSYNSSTWNTTILDQNSSEPDAVINNLDQIHIVYYCGGIKRGYFNGTNWEFSTIGSGGSPSIALDSYSNEHIAYTYSYYTPPPYPQQCWELKYAKQNGASWSYETIETSTYPSDIYMTDIAVDSSGFPHILYNKGYSICYAYKSGSAWQMETIETGEMGASLTQESIALDSEDHPHVTYYVQYNGHNDMEYAYNDGSGWQTDEFDPGGAYWDPHIALNSEGIPYITYGYSYGWPNPLNSIRCAHYTDIPTGTTLTNFTANSQITGAVKLHWETTDPASVGIGYNIYREESKSKSKNDIMKINDETIYGRSPFDYTDQSAKKGLKYRYKLTLLSGSGKEKTIGTATNSSPAISQPFEILSVFPQPANSSLTCRMNVQQASTLKLSLYDLSGRFVKVKQVNANPGNFDMNFSTNDLTNGIYFIKVTDGINRRTVKVLIAH